MDLRKQRIEIAVTSAVLALTGYLQYVAYTSKVRDNVQGLKSMDFPKIMLYVMMLLCVIVLINGVRNYRRLKKEAAARQTEEQPKEPFIHKKVLVSIALIILYTVGWELIGFVFSSLIFVFIESRLLDSDKPWWQALAVAVVYTVIVYSIFHFGFGVQFPEPILEAILG